LKDVAVDMGPTSRLLVADMVLPDKTEMGGDMTIYWLKFSMKMLNGREEMVKLLSAMLGAARLEFAKVWIYNFGT
jgi:hypothetical protein